jgi:hypothetical protein
MAALMIISKYSEGENPGTIDHEHGNVWKGGVLPVFVIAVTAFPLAILLTLRLQILGTLLSFFLTGLVGGYLAGPSRSKGLYVGIVGSAATCVVGVVFLLAIVSRTLENVEELAYFASYALWLSLAAPVNLFFVVIPVGGLGGAFGGEIRTRIRGHAARSTQEKRGDRGACSPQT